MGKGEEGLPDPQGLKEISCLSMKAKGGFAQGIVDYFDVGPANSFAIPESQGLEKGLLGRESNGETFGGAGHPLTAADLFFRENTEQKEVAPSRQEVLDPVDIDNVNARSKDHKTRVEGSKGRGG